MLKSFSKKKKITSIIILLFTVAVIILIFLLLNKDAHISADDIVGESIEDVLKISDDSALYKHPEREFSIEYPKELRALLFKEKDGSETIVFQEDDNKSNGFQIFIQPFEEDKVLTKERILEDLPNAVIDDPQEVIIGSNIHALIFWSQEPRLGKVREVWFTHNRYLYEVTAYADFDSQLAEILSTWSFSVQ